MKSFKRKLAGFLAFAMVLGLLAPGAMKVQAVDNASTEPAKKVSIDLEKETADVSKISAPAYFAKYTEYTKGGIVTVSGSAADAVLWVKTNEQDAGKELVIKDSAWDDVEEDAKTLDLEWVSKKKANLLIFSYQENNETKYEFFEIKGQETSVKAGFVAASSGAAIGKGNSAIQLKKENLAGGEDVGYIYLTKKAADGATEVVDLTKEAVQWKKGANGTWKTLNKENFEEDLKGYRAKGATLYFRLASTDVDAVWPSKEAKLSYKKQANKPSVKLDVNKHTIALKAGQQYKVLIGGVWSDWIDALEAHPQYDAQGAIVKNKIAKEITIGELKYGKNNIATVGDYYYVQDVTIKVRTAAGKAIPSKVTTIDVEVAKDVTDWTAVTTEFLVPYDENKGVELSNSTLYDLQFTTVTPSTITAKTKWSSLKAAKLEDGKPVAKTAKIKANRLEDGVYDTSSYDPTAGIISVRQAGNKKENILAGKPKTFNIADINNKVTQTWAYVKYTDNTPETVTKAGIEVDTNTANTITVEVTRNAANKDIKFDLELKFTKLEDNGTGKVVNPEKARGEYIPSVKAAKVETVSTEGSVAKMAITVGKNVKVKTGGYKYTCTYEGLKYYVVIVLVDNTTASSN